MKITTGTCKYPTGKVFSGKYGDRVNAVFVTTDGEEVKVWDKPGSAIANVAKDQTVDLVYDGKNWKAANLPEPAASPQQQPESRQHATNGRRIPTGDRIKALTRLWAQCHDLALESLPEIASPSVISQCASDVFHAQVRYMEGHK